MASLLGPNGETTPIHPHASARDLNTSAGLESRLTASERVQRDAGKRELQKAKEELARRNGADSIQFQDYFPNGDQDTATPGSFVECWKDHLHVNGKPCPFRIEPAPGAFVCLPCKKPDRSPEGIIMPDVVQDPEIKRRGIVIAVGPSWTNEHGITCEAPPLKPGDEVLYSKYMVVEPAGKDWPINPVPFDCYLGKIVRAKAEAKQDGKATPKLALTS